MDYVNPTPNRDGQDLIYAESDSSGTGRPQVFYVNGIRTPPDAHRDIAILLSRLLERQVLGIYNKHDKIELTLPFGPMSLRTGIHDDGYVADLLLECLPQWLQSGAAVTAEQLWNAVSSFPGWLGAHLRRVVPKGSGVDQVVQRIGAAVKSPRQRVGAAIDLIWKTATPHLRQSIARAWVSPYPSAKRLFELLASGQYEDAVIVPHSQGNLITVHALWALKLAKGQAHYEKMRVFSLASPVTGWPDGAWIRLYAMTGDPVAWMSLGRTYRGPGQDSKSEFGLAAHDVERNIFGTAFANDIRAHLGLGGA
ncbi:MAG: hypothetical protein KDE27_23325 [Planctomycetes bacterium]|nr:hypothetical protein [Planctomycetota bacterium]